MAARDAVGQFGSRRGAAIGELNRQAAQTALEMASVMRSLA